MERGLIRAIMNPAMVIAIGCGVGMLYAQPALLHLPWMHAKLGARAFLLGYHGLASWVRLRFAEGQFVLGVTACRVINEVPTIRLFVIVIAVIVRL